MISIQVHLDGLDRMIDTDAKKANIRSQAAFIALEVAKLEHAHSELLKDYAKLKQEYSEFKTANPKQKANRDTVRVKR